MKNKKHFEKYNLNNTLESFMTLEQNELSKIVSSITSIHLNKLSKNEIELRKKQNIYELYIEMVLIQASKLNTPFEITKRTLLDAIPSRTTKANHGKMFEKLHLELETDCKPYKDKIIVQKIMKELCLL